MAKTKTSAADIGCFAVVAMVFVLAIVGPIALAIWCVFCELRALAYRTVHSVHDVLNPQEQAELANAEVQVSHIEDEIERSVRYGLASGFSQRADRMFDARRVKARDLNIVLESLYLRRSDAQLTYDEVYRRLGRRMSRWLNARASLFGSRAALIAYVVVFIAVVASSGADLSLSTLMFGEAGSGSTRMGASISAMVVAIIAMLIVRSKTVASLAS